MPLLKIEKYFLVAAAVLLLFATVASALYREFHYARELEIIGTVLEIQSHTTNHGLPGFVILNEKNKKIAISQFTVALDPKTVKIGDRIVKAKGDDFCMVNGERVRFSSGTD